MTLSRLALVSCLVAAGSLSARADQAPAASTLSWDEAVKAHVPGTIDDAVRTVAAIDMARLTHQVKRFGLADVPFLTRALVLHTDLAIAQREAAARMGGRGYGSSVVLEDGRQVGRRQASPHWGIALAIANTLAERRDAEARRVARLWFGAVNALFLYWAESSPRLLENAFHHWPDDASLHVYRATHRQMLADPRVQQSIAVDDAPTPSVGRIRPREFADEPPPDVERTEIRRARQGGPQRSSGELARAEEDLRRALTLDPTLVEARIRLAHVAGERGGAAEAVALAQEALRVGVPPFFESYATLILGRNLARLGRYVEAGQAFDRAAALVPSNQAPRIGRAQVALALGRPAEAMAALTAILGPERAVAPTDEAWSLYYRVSNPAAPAQLAALRAEVK
jgi:tetratricopeptide (TPR) repeat protein